MALLAGVANADNNRFVFSDQSVKDKRTGLSWTRDVNLGKMDWYGAFELVKEMNRKKFGGFNDWHIPSNDEFKTLTTYAESIGFNSSKADSSAAQKIPERFAQHLNRLGFYDVPSVGLFWTSSPVPDFVDHAWVAVLGMGVGGHAHKSVDGFGPCFVWPVRAGQ